MVKHLSKLLLLVALCVPWALRAQSTLTVCDGTSTSSYFPVYGYYMDTPQESQMIYSDADLTAMRGMNISQMTFYVESSGYGSDWGSNTTTVSLAVTTATSVPTTFVSETMTTVYTGTIDVSANQLVITFDNEFAYPLTGGNLLVDFTVTSAGDYKDYLFYGISALGMSYMEDESSNYSGDLLLPTPLLQTVLVLRDLLPAASLLPLLTCHGRQAAPNLLGI